MVTCLVETCKAQKGYVTIKSNLLHKILFFRMCLCLSQIHCYYEFQLSVLFFFLYSFGSFVQFFCMWQTGGLWTGNVHNSGRLFFLSSFLICLLTNLSGFVASTLHYDMIWYTALHLRSESQRTGLKKERDRDSEKEKGRGGERNRERLQAITALACVPACQVGQYRICPRQVCISCRPYF